MSLRNLVRLQIFMVVAFLSSFSHSAPLLNASCKVYGPTVKDKVGRFCPQGYTITLNDYIIDNNCYSTVAGAQSQLEKTPLCQADNNRSYGYCQLLFPEQQDRSQRYCEKSVGVSYFGYLLDGQCFSSAEAALSTLKTTDVCYQAPFKGRCRILQPNEKDVENMYCSDKYGLAVDGRLQPQRCYSSLSYTLKQMQVSPVCQPQILLPQSVSSMR